MTKYGSVSVSFPKLFMKITLLFRTVLSSFYYLLFGLNNFYYFLSFLKRFYLFIFREREGREKVRERNSNVLLLLARPLLGSWPATQACALTGYQTGGPLVRSLVLSPLSHTT